MLTPIIYVTHNACTIDVTAGFQTFDRFLNRCCYQTQTTTYCNYNVTLYTAEVGVEHHALLQKWAWNVMLYSLTAEKLEQLHKTILMEQKKNTFYSEVSTGILGVYYSDVCIIHLLLPPFCHHPPIFLSFLGRRSKDYLIFTTAILSLHVEPHSVKYVHTFYCPLVDADLMVCYTYYSLS